MISFCFKSRRCYILPSLTATSVATTTTSTSVTKQLSVLILVCEEVKQTLRHHGRHRIHHLHHHRRSLSRKLCQLGWCDHQTYITIRLDSEEFSSKFKHVLDVVHSGNGCISIGILVVSNETETSATSGVAVLNNDLQNRLANARVGKYHRELTASSTAPNSSNF